MTELDTYVGGFVYSIVPLWALRDSYHKEVISASSIHWKADPAHRRDVADFAEHVYGIVGKALENEYELTQLEALTNDTPRAKPPQETQKS